MKMKNFFFFLIPYLIFPTQHLNALDFVQEKKVQRSEIRPPVALQIPHKLTKHQDTRIDPYYWFNQKDNPEVIKYLEEENRYTDKMMEPTLPLQKLLFKEMKGRIYEEDQSAPYLLNDYYYYYRYSKGQEYPQYFRKKGSLQSPEELILDVNKLAEGQEYCSVVGLAVSQDNKILAFGLDTMGRRIYTLQFKNLVTGELLQDKISNTTGDLVWAQDSQTVFYTVQDETLRSDKVMRHILGSPSQDDEEVFHEEDETYSVSIDKTRSNKYILLTSYSTLSTEVRFLDAALPLGQWQVLQPRKRNLEYTVDHHEDKFLIVTNYKAKNFRLMQTSVKETTLENWQEFLPHREDVLLSDVLAFKNFIVLRERKFGLPQIHVLDLKNKRDYYLKFEEETYDAYTQDNYEYENQILRYSFTSLNTPSSIFDLNMELNEKKLIKRKKILGKFAPQDYQTKRLQATASDGTMIPISLIYKKGLKRPEGNPLLLYGYGSYGYSLDPEFSSNHLSLLDRGFVYALAHVRGGQEMGRDWYENGKLMKKQNSFMDFIACARHLVREKYSRPAWLFAEGASAGGLLMGAVVNIGPELFRGVLSHVPFVDVVTTMLDDTIPLTTAEYDEWGNPNQKEFYDYMLSYSPYDNVAKKKYPAMLVTSALHDSQVQYWEPTKWVAKLRANKTDKNPLLLKTNMHAGHSGKSGRFQQLEEEAFNFSFILDQVGGNWQRRQGN